MGKKGGKRRSAPNTPKTPKYDAKPTTEDVLSSRSEVDAFYEDRINLPSKKTTPEEDIEEYAPKRNELALDFEDDEDELSDENDDLDGEYDGEDGEGDEDEFGEDEEGAGGEDGEGEEDGEGDEDEGDEDGEDEEEDDSDLEFLRKDTKKDTETGLGWGGNAKRYHEKHSHQIKGVADEEEEVDFALEEQKDRRAALDADDYGDVEGSAATTGTRKSADSALLDAMNKDLDSIDFGEGEVETLSKKLLTKEDKLNHLQKESPELLDLLAEFKEKIVEIKEVLDPILKKVKSNEIPTSKGISFLEVKHQLLLSYCINISFYLMLKSEGKSVKNHPVIDQLVKIRTILEKMKPIESKLKHQVEKLVRIAKTGVAEPSELHRPNPTGLVVDADDEPADVYTDNLYKPLKTAAVALDQEDAKKAKKEKAILRAEKRAKDSRLSKFIEEEFGDKPEEVGEGTEMYQEDRRDAELREFEESMMTRYGNKKAERKKQQKKLNAHNDILQDLGDFGDMAGVEDKEDVAAREAAAYLQEKRFKKYMETVDKKRGRDSDDDEDNMLSGSDIEPTPKKSKKERGPRRPTQTATPFIPSAEPRLGSGQKRSITQRIEKNRGLTKSRPKDSKNPHTKYRAKYDKALSRDKSVRPSMRDGTLPYAGERRINKNMVKAKPLDYQFKPN